MPSRIEPAPAAQRDLRRLPAQTLARLDALYKLSPNNPRPHGSRKLRGEEDAWRIRIGPYRVVYDVHDDLALVVALKVARRGEATYKL